MRAQTTFFHDLAAAAGRSVPLRTVDAVVRPMLGALDPAVSDIARLSSDLSELAHRLGLTLTSVRPQLEEAISLADGDRPVLLVVKRGEGLGLIAVHRHDGSRLVVESLLDGQFEKRTVDVAQFAAEFGLDAGDLAYACRVGTMGSREPEETLAILQGKPLQRLWRFLSPDRPEITLVVLFAVAVGVLTLVTPIAVQTLVNFVAFGGVIQPLIVLGILMLFFMAFAGAIRVFKLYVVEILQRRVFVRVVSDLSVRLPRVRVDSYDRGYSPELVNRFFDVMTVQKAGSTLLIDGLDVALQAGIGLIVLGFYHPFLLVFDFLLLASIAFILLVVGRGAIASAMKESKAKYAVAGALEELARAPVTYKLFGAPELARARLAELSATYVSARRKHFRVLFRQKIGAVTLHAIASTALLTIGGFLVITEQLTLGQLIAAELIVSLALTSFVKFHKQLESYYDMLAGVDKLGQLYDLPLEEDEGESHTPPAAGASLELRGVTYAYPGHAPVIRGLDLFVASGERVAVLGRRGAGKSTIADLVSGLRDAQSGVVLFDGIDIHDVANSSIRFHMNLVKGFELVEGSVIENVRLGQSDVSIDEVRDALALFGILDELMELPDGLRTQIGYQGTPLSQSTAYLLMLARSIVGGPRAIVVDTLLDELDRPCRERALGVLAGPEAPWTLLVLTNSEEVCAVFDRVYRLEHGTSDGLDPRHAAPDDDRDDDEPHVFLEDDGEDL